ncbi:hypothetical protein FHG64_01310 [Antarcticibacterium flavum]|uniref:Uncharacterized protein n=1 Tax=Antarcticibacterium flavum TaxID=2058175 RepID=A0A5B7X0L2_9FLAO|nr:MULTISPECIES: hypothetical protein [Antarcticibacterium]MCM4158886.1 hypothetical protein [Antarcticibacterium sp. W02-3]QCY68141.1 hypothetical protein FHG64_01310 [Antarcticibacterium flavum]
MLKIPYSNQRLNSHIKQAIYFIAIGVILLIIFAVYNGAGEMYGSSAGAGLIAGGVFTFGVYLFERQKKYITINNDSLIKNKLFPEKVSLDNVLQIKKYAGDIILKTEKDEFVIDTQIIDSEYTEVLERELKL